MPAPFQLLADHPALDLVNTLDNRFAAAGPTELLRGYADLLDFVRQEALLNGRQIGVLAARQESAAAARVLRAAHGLREALAALLYGKFAGAREPPARAIKSLESHFLDADEHQVLVWRRPAPGSAVAPRVAWDWGRFATRLELPVWVLAKSAADLLTSSAMDHVHQCTSETCRWVFLDSSKNHSRRWCDMKVCGNRSKARRFHARRET